MNLAIKVRSEHGRRHGISSERRPVPFTARCFTNHTDIDTAHLLTCSPYGHVQHRTRRLLELYQCHWLIQYPLLGPPGGHSRNRRNHIKLDPDGSGSI